MSKKKIVFVVSICVVIFFSGFLVGRISLIGQGNGITTSVSKQTQYREAYTKGWVYYYNRRASDPSQYYNAYVYGRNFNQKFNSIN